MKITLLALLTAFSFQTFADTPSQEILVLFKNSNFSAQMNVLRNEGFADHWVARARGIGHPRLQLIKIQSPESLEMTLAKLKQNPAVQFAEPNYPVYMVGTESVQIPSDSNFDSQWNLQNKGQEDADRNAGVVGADINVVPVWKSGVTGSKKVLVATIDSGIDLTHPDLVGNLYENPGEAGAKATNGVDDDANGYIDDVHGANALDHNNQTNDDNGHGSHVAGIIGATGNNGIGVSGINWQVSLMPVKVLNGMGAGTTQSVIEGIIYAVKMKAQVINNSWAMTQKSDILESVMKEAETKGVIMVAAAGNSFVNLDSFTLYPASFALPNMISVAASNNRDLTWNLSDTGPNTVDVAAPGENILSTYKKGGYKVSSGTSMAAPQVTGIAALLLSAHPEWDYREIKKRIVDSCIPSVEFRHKVKCQGRVDVWNALQGIKPINNFKQNADFTSVPFIVESAHPYLSRSNIDFEVKKPGAKFIRVHMARIEFEWDHDHLYVEDAKGQIVEELDGTMYNYSTDYVEGDTLKLHLKADGSRNFYGFKVDAIEFIP